MIIYSARRALPFRNWPGIDRMMWCDLYRAGDVLDGRGPLAHLRPATRGIYQKDYGFWLGHLVSLGVDLAVEDPGVRLSLERLRSFDAALDGLAPATRHSRFTSLIQVMQKARPESDWTRLRKAVARLQRLARGVSTRNKSERIASSADLAGLGLDLIARSANVRHRLHGPLMHRDGVMLIFLAYHPLRIRNFGGLRLGQSLLRTPGGFRIVLEPDETKNHRPDERQVNPRVAAALDVYLEEIRPQLAARSKHSTDHVWLTQYGRSCEPRRISERISTVTRRELGLALSAHLFRDSAVTTVIENAPDQAWLTRGLLHHADFAVTERHYNHARQIEAARRWAALLDNLAGGPK